MQMINLIPLISHTFYTCSILDHALPKLSLPSRPTNYLESTNNGGWVTNEEDQLALSGPCTIDIRNAETFSEKEFILEYADVKPVVIKGASDNEVFKALTRKKELLSAYGHSQVSLSSANSYSYDRRTVSFEDYCTDYIKPQKISTLGNETFYFFGDNGNEDWKPLMNQYKIPPYNIPNHRPQLSFGVAGAGSGVPFHFHGPGFAETLWVRKRWFMYPPHISPQFHPNRTTLQWLFEEYPKLKDDDNLYECTLNPGELVYFPSHWWHATLNLDASVFISTFLGL